MTLAARLAAAALVAGACAPLAAQSQGDPVHLDDFAVGAQGKDTLRVEQLPAEGHAVGGSERPVERNLTADAPAAPAAARLPQLSAEGQSPQQAQISRPGAAPDESAAAISSTAQSRPQAVARLEGRDRCDPQLGEAERERCRRILELRAQEFNAPAPPELSPEQKLLAEQRSDDEAAAGRSTVTRLRLASRDDPDANLQSNQELAALYLGKQTPPPSQPATPDSTAEGDASLAQILESLQVATSGGQSPP
jgi:hypothetical protein